MPKRFSLNHLFVMGSGATLLSPARLCRVEWSYLPTRYAALPIYTGQHNKGRRERRKGEREKGDKEEK